MTDTPIPFRTLEDAYWNWLNANCPHKSGPQRKAWLAENPFVHEGVRYVREASPMKSNSRKSIVGWRVYFYGPGMELVATNADDVVPNRANDPARNWGLGRE